MFKINISTGLERMATRMIDYCSMNCLVINSGKTQLLISSKEDFEVKVGENTIKAAHQISLLGITYDTNFSTAPYLQNLAVQAKTRAKMIYRLSFGIPNHLLKILTNGLLIGKIAAAAPAAIPFKIEYDDRASNLAREKINRAIKSAARTITKTSLKDMVSSEKVLQQAGLRSVNEIVASTSVVMVWKAKKQMNPLGKLLFPKGNILRPSRLLNANKARQPVPGNCTLATNLMARAWNAAKDLHDVETLGVAKEKARKWASNLVKS